MIVQVNTDKNITSGERLTTIVTDEITSSLERFSDNITRVEVHLSDENAGKTGENDKRCLLEARIEGLKPVVVTNFDNSVEASLSGAIDKMISALDTTFGKLKNH
jgi:ribosome-associated translation inhibitor RaiA